MDLIGVRFQLQAINKRNLNPRYTTRLHAWFLNEVRKFNPNLSQYLHDKQAEKPFTLSHLEGVSYEENFAINIESFYYWTITGLNSLVIDWLQEWLDNPPQVIDLKDVSFQIRDINIIYPLINYQSLLETPREKTLALSFITPTSFRHKNHHFPLPLPFHVFQSYLRRWNLFSDYLVDSDSFLEWVNNHVIILRHQLHTLKVAGGKKGMLTGFVGAIEYGLSTQGSRNQDFRQLLFALGKLAPYCGTGHKTTFGLGQTRYGWLLESESKMITIDNLLLKRIEEITQILMSFQKRKGGERALKVCKMRATILARQERGESLKEIAKALNVPYETVKTYAKLARKLIKS